MSYDFPCVHRGAPTGETFNCGSERGLQPVYACGNAPLGGLPCVIAMCAKKENIVKGRLQSCASCKFREDPNKKQRPTVGPRPPGVVLPGDIHRERQRQRLAAAAIPPVPPGEYPAGASEAAKRRLSRVVDYGDKLQYITTKRMIDDTLNLLLPQLPPNLSAVAGVPRSGMAAAAVLSCHLQLPLLTVRGGQLVDVGAGSRGRQGWAGDRGGKTLIVDDSVYGGGNMRRLRETFGDRALLSAIYVRPEMAGLVDFYAYKLPSPHILQWNVFNGAPLQGKTINPILHGGIALDFDGVVCVDPDVPDRDEARYLDWLQNALPLNVPRRHPIPLIVTFRLEKYRQATLDWLARWQIRAEKLVMYPGTREERNVRFDAAEHKGIAYRDSPCRLFIESSAAQSRAIHLASGKPVLCLQTETIHQ